MLGSKKAFTLAEVLISLGILGVIAAMVIPVMMQRIEQRQHYSNFNVGYSTLSKAYSGLRAKNAYDMGSYIGSNASQMMTLFETVLRVDKDCGTGTGCLPEGKVKYLNGTTYSATFDATMSGTYQKAILASGAMMFIDLYSPNCDSTSGNASSGELAGSLCGMIGLDVNGAFRPNTLGRDIFYFWFTKDKIVPFGAVDGDSYGCSPTAGDWKSNEGWGCAGRLVKDKEMNY